MAASLIPMRADRQIGSTDLAVAPLGMGCARLGAFWQGRSIRSGQRALEEAVDGGVTFFDTADSYTRGISERLVGRALGANRDRVVICTKVGYVKTPAAARAAQRSLAVDGPTGGSAEGRCFSPTYVRLAAERSLRRLRTDRIDMLLLHSPDARTIASGDFWDGVARLRQSGAVRYFGISCDTPEDSRAALETGAIDCLEVAYNVRVREATDPVLAEAARRGVGVVARSVFGDGALLAPPSGGAGGTATATDPGRAQACLQVALAAPAVAVVLAGMTRPMHVRANVAAVSRPPLTAEEVRVLLGLAEREGPGC